MKPSGRRRVLWDYVGGALWVLPALSVVVFLLAGAALSRIIVDEGSPLSRLAFQGTAEDIRSLLIVVSSTMITVTGLVFALFVAAFAYAMAGLFTASVGVLISFIHQPRFREAEELSPAINDPYTGVQAVQHLSVLLCGLARLRLGDRTARDAHGELRVAVPRPTFPDNLRLGRPRSVATGPPSRP